jgi:hypothetical protein
VLKGGGIESLGAAASNEPVMLALDDGCIWNTGGMKSGRGKLSAWRETYLGAPCP